MRQINLFLLLTCLFLRLPAQDLQGRYLGIENGLSNNVVYAIHQDHRGFMWFGTYDGLNMYDGYGFTTYRNIIGDSTSLSSNNINTIGEDHLHQLWIGGQKEVNILDPITKKFSIPKYRFHDGTTKNNLADNVISIKVVPGKFTIAGTQHNGLFQFADKTIGKQVPIFYRNKLLTNYYVSSIDYDTAVHLAYVFIQEEGLFSIDLLHKKARLISDKIRYASFIKIGRHNNIWIGTDHALYSYDRQKGVLSEGFMPVDRPVVNVCEDRDGVLWIATDGAGVWQMKKGDKVAQQLPADPDGSSLLNSNAIYTIYEDHEKRKWIGTLRGGVNIIEPSSVFKKVVFAPGDKQSSIKNFIFSFSEDADGKIWIGTDGAGLRRWDRNSNTYETFTYNDQDPSSISSNFITSIIKDSRNDTWIATWFSGINKFNPATKKFKRYKLYNTKSRSNSENVWRMMEDSKGNLWAAAVRNGALFRYDKVKDVFTEFDNRLAELQALAEDRRGTLWAGNYSSLIKIDTDRKHHQYIQVGYPVRSIYEDKKGNFWIGTQEGGLMLFNRENNTIKRITTKEGLSNNTILRILEENDGSLWLSTYNGLTRFNPSTNEMQIFTQSDGLQSNQFSFNAALKLQSGEMLFGGIKGFNIFDPRLVRNRNSSAGIFLSSVEVSNRPLEEQVSLIREHTTAQATHIVVPYDKAILSLQYLGLDYADAANISYSYLLKGWDKDWTNAGANRRANYSRLREGNYDFMVRMADRQSGWSEPATLLKITILPPWYRSWWAYLGYFILIGSLIYIYIVYKTRQARLQYQVQLANLEVQQEKELNERKISFFTNVSHEFRTPLALIINPIKDLISKEEDQAGKAELQVIYRNARRLLRLVDQLLLFKKADQDTLQKEKINVYNLSREVFLCFVEQARTRKIAYELKCEQMDLVIFGDLQKIEIALFNLLSNAFKFTPDEGRIILEIKSTDQKVILSISDTGIGISQEEAPKLFQRFAQARQSKNKMGFGIGLYLVKTFVEAHGGSVCFKSDPGKGTTFTLELDRFINEGFAPLEVDPPTSAFLEEMTEDPETRVADLKEIIVPDELATEKQTILVIDDDNEIRHYLVSIFSDQYKVLQAETGAAGLKIVQKQLPDLVVSDIVMPDMDGLELCRTLKEDPAFTHIPVVLLTGTSSDDVQLKGMQHGADDYIKKPFDKEILVARITAILKRKNILQQYFFNEITLGPAKYKVSAEYREFLEKCMHIIEEHLLDDTFSIKILAREMGMSHSNLYKKIRVVSGQSVNSFIRFVRLKKAAELLISSEMNINETASTVGIQSMKYFRQQFHALFGMNPSDYVKKYRGTFHNTQSLEQKVRK